MLLNLEGIREMGHPGSESDLLPDQVSETRPEAPGRWRIREIPRVPID
jgi:hypothetical protein